MNKISRISFTLLLALTLAACHEETDDSRVLRISFASAETSGWSWLAASQMVLDYLHLNYTQAYLAEFHYDKTGHEYASASDVGWLLWDLADVETYVTGTLSFREIRSNIDWGFPIVLQYGDYEFGEYAVLHGYDDYGYVYLHEPFYGTRVIHYDDLFLRYLAGNWEFWNASLIIGSL